MLDAMDRLEFGVWRKSDKFCYFQIFIMPLDICVCMMDHIVGDFPDIAICANQVKRQTNDVVNRTV